MQRYCSKNPYAALTFGGRPALRRRSIMTPSSMSCPPQTPHGSWRESAPSRHALRIGQFPQRAFACAITASSSAKKISGSDVWHGKVKALASSYVNVTSLRPIYSPDSAQPGTCSSLKRTVIVLTLFLSRSFVGCFLWLVVLVLVLVSGFL